MGLTVSESGLSFDGNSQILRVLDGFDTASTRCQRRDRSSEAMMSDVILLAR